MRFTKAQIKELIEAKAVPNDIGVELAKQLLETIRRTEAIEDCYKAIHRRSFYWISCNRSKRDVCELETGVVVHPYAPVRETNDVQQIATRLDAQWAKYKGI